MPKALEIPDDIIKNSTLEKQSQSQEVVFYYLHATTYPNTALGWTVWGPVENIKPKNHKNLVNNVIIYYKGPRRVPTVTGGVSYDE